jgi:aspartate carbamoyltransferase catalytic subunit
MNKKIISINDLDTSEILHILKKAAELKLNDVFETLINKKLTLLFLENSTRTKNSFEIAIKNLSGHVINFSAETSSLAKNETVLDTVLTLEAMGMDGIVIRTSNHAELIEIAKQTRCSIINAGSGTSEHPTQALLDLLTIQNNFKNLKDLKITLIGDIEKSRVAKSNIQLLQNFGMNVRICGPDQWVKGDFNVEKINPEEAYKNSDVIILLRAQLERETIMPLKSDEYLKEFGFNSQKEKLMKPNSIIMHPAPFMRNVEIESELVNHPRSKIFEQVSNGVKVRMALLKYLYS